MIFSPYVDEHIGVDHEHSPHKLSHVDVVADAYEIPLPDESVDMVLLSAFSSTWSAQRMR